MKKVQFTLDYGRKKKDGKGLIELRAYLNGKQKYFSTKIYVSPNQWNKGKQQVVRHNNKENLNEQLDALVERLEKEQRKAFDYDQAFNLETVKALMNKEGNKTDSFTEFALKEVDQDNGIIQSTKHSKLNTINKLLDFNAKKPVLFVQINYAYCHDFINYVKGLGYKPSTIKKHHKNFKSLLELAIRKGYYQKANPLKEIAVKVPVQKVVSLTKEQVRNIEELKFQPIEERLELFRDMFLFSCYTGLRVSDIMSLKNSHLKTTEEGLNLVKVSVKTKKEITLPLNKLFPIEGLDTSKPIRILDKYRDTNREYVFKQYCSQVYNRDLKTIANKARVTDLNLTAHIGRKTFATYIANNTSLSTWELKYLLQHSNIKTTEKYVQTDEKRLNESLSRTEWE